MSTTNSQKTYSLMFLSMLLGGVLVYSYDRLGGKVSRDSTSPHPEITATEGKSMPKGHPIISPENSSMAAVPQEVGSIDNLVVGLRNRLEANPNDPKGWALLAKSYQHLGQEKAAMLAAEKAAQHGYVGQILAPPAGKPKNPHVLIHQESPMYDDDFFKSSDSQPKSAN